MKSTLLLFALVGSGAVVSAQSNIGVHAKTQRAAINTNRIVDTPTPSTALTFGDTLYSNDFSDPTTLTVANNPATGWIFGNAAGIGSGFLGGAAPQTAFASTTAANGYAMFDSDGYGASVNANSSITTGPIDLTGATGDISINFEQWYARFNDTASVLVSVNGIDFVKVGDNMDIPRLSSTSGAATANPMLKTILISQYAGQTIYVRFNYKANYDYTWIIDDLTITEVEYPAADFSVTKAFNGNYKSQYSYAQIPLSQADSLGFTLISRNDGGQAQTYMVNYEIKLNGAVVGSGTANSAGSVASFASDTLAFTTDFVPAAIGTYTMNLSLVVAGDVSTDNNDRSLSFEITNFLMSPIAGNLASSTALTLSGAGPAGSYDIYKVGQNFLLENDQELRAVDIALFKPAGFSGTQDFTIELYQLDETTGRPSENFIDLTDYSMTTSHSNTAWKTVTFSAPISLSAGVGYVVAVGYDQADKVFAFNGSSDGDLDLGTWAYGPFGAANAVNWFVGFSFSPGIRLNFDTEIGINEKSGLSAQLFVAPNPANTNLRVTLSNATPEAYSLNLVDLNGRVVYTKSQTSKVSVISENIALDNLANGIYTLQVITSSGVASSKVVVAH